MNETQKAYIQAQARYQAAIEAMQPYDDLAMKALDDDETAFDKSAEITGEGMRVTGYNEALDAKIKAREVLLAWVRDELRNDPRWKDTAPLFEIKSPFWREKAADVAAKLKLEDA
jgi:hypothetical protein